MFKQDLVVVEELEQITEASGSRRYLTPTGVKYPSITTILSAKSKPFIDAWRKRVGDEEADRIGRVASLRGTKIHALCEDVLNNIDIEDKVDSMNYIDKQMFQNFRPLLNGIGLIRSIESKLYSDHLRVAGQVDCVAEYNGVNSIIDFKTSKRIKTKSQCEGYFIQCTAYAIMFEERTGIPISQIVILMAVEGEEPIEFIEKRDNYVAKLMDARDAFENA